MKEFYDSLFTRISGLGSDLRSKPKMKDSEKDWLEQRIILVVKGTIDEYVSIESRVRTRWHFDFLTFYLTIVLFIRMSEPNCAISTMHG